MDPIKKEYAINALKIKARISDGFVVLVTNQPQVTREIYNQCLQAGKHVIWSQRNQAVTQFYTGLFAEEIEKLVDLEVAQVRKEGKIAFEKLQDGNKK